MAGVESIEPNLDQSVVVSDERCRWFGNKCSWRPTSKQSLEAAEARILRHIKAKCEGKFVHVEDLQHIWTLKFNPNATKVPLVLVHGFGGGIGLWALNIDALAKNRTVYAIDVLGFGRSSRPRMNTDAQQAEEQFVRSIENWRQLVGLDKFVLVGHSLGGFLASAYALKHPTRIHHLVLADPWGFPERPSDEDLSRNIPTWIKVVGALLRPFNPLAGMRAAGPWGPSLVQRFRPDIQQKYSRLFEDDTMLNYIYHCNAQKPSGETAFKNMNVYYGWAKFPMINRIGNLDKNVPITMIHGAESWIDQEIGYQTKYIRSESFVDVQVIPWAGHHVYADQPDAFNKTVEKICRRLDKRIDLAID